MDHRKSFRSINEAANNLLNEASPGNVSHEKKEFPYLDMITKDWFNHFGWTGSAQFGARRMNFPHATYLAVQQLEAALSRLSKKEYKDIVKNGPHGHEALPEWAGEMLEYWAGQFATTGYTEGP